MNLLELSIMSQVAAYGKMRFYDSVQLLFAGAVEMGRSRGPVSTATGYYIQNCSVFLRAVRTPPLPQ